MIYQIHSPAYITTQYKTAIASGDVFICDDSDFELHNVICPNCGIRLGHKVIGADYYQPFKCQKCKGVFVYDLRYFKTRKDINEDDRLEWLKQAGIID